MSDLKDLNRRFYKEVFENRNLDAVDELVSDEFIEHEEPPPGIDLAPGRDGVKQLCRVYLDAFDPLSVDVHAMYQDGDTVIARITFRGTHSGEFIGIPASDKPFAADGIDIIRFEGDRAAEHWGFFDAMALLTQIGAIPEMG